MLSLTEDTEVTEKTLDQGEEWVATNAMSFTTLRRVSLAQGRQDRWRDHASGVTGFGKVEHLNQGKTFNHRLPRRSLKDEDGSFRLMEVLVGTMFLLGHLDTCIP